MTDYKLKISETQIHILRKFPPLLKQKIRSSLDAIVKNPQVGKSLKEELRGLQSLRVGNFRIIYKTHKQTIEIITIGSRATIYKEALRLIKK